MALVALSLGRPEGATAPGVAVTRWTLDVPVLAAAFAGNGAHAAFGLDDGSVRLVALARFGGRRMTATAVHHGPVRALSADGATGGVLSLGADGRVVQLDGAGAATALLDPQGAHGGARLVAGGWLRAVATAGEVIVYDRAGHVGWRAGCDGASALAASPSGDTVAAARGREVTVWRDRPRETPAAALSASAPVHALAFSPYGRRLAAATDSPTALVWDLGHAAGTGALFGSARDLAWSACGRALVGAGDGALLCWRTDRRVHLRGWHVPMAVAPMAGCAVTALACHPRHPLAAAGYDDGSVLLADLDHGRDRVIRHGAEDAVSALAWSPQGSHLACATAGGEAALFDFTTLVKRPH